MNYKKGPIIGRGSTATVSLATTVTGDLIAVKSANLSTSQFLQKEQQLLSKLRSPYVIEYIGYDVDYIDNIPMYNILMEYAPNGTISDVIKKHKQGCFNECLIRSYTHQILLGLDYIHSNNFVHCDIKCDNILVCNDGVKIGDFGCAKFVEMINGENTNTSSEFSGTPVFMAPEVARGEEQGFVADVWAVGCVVIEMATGCNPWPQMTDPVSALYRIGYSGDVPLFPRWFSDEGKDFLNKCLLRNGEERWSVKELLQHPFVNSNSGFEKIETFSKSSPSSILDQGFWDSFELSEPSQEVSQLVNVSDESPVDRIRQLVEERSSCLPNWVDEEDWITVRINHINEISKISEHNLNTNVDAEDDDSESTRTDTFLYSDVYVEELFTRFVRMMLESDVVETIDVSVFVSRFHDFKNMNNDNCFLINSKLSFTLLGNLFMGKSNMQLAAPIIGAAKHKYFSFFTLNI